jgi:hypothetical protein
MRFLLKIRDALQEKVKLDCLCQKPTTKTQLKNLPNLISPQKFVPSVVDHFNGEKSGLRFIKLLSFPSLAGNTQIAGLGRSEILQR